MNEIRRIDTADVAKLIRQDLKAVFGKAVKFSVRSSRYSGGSSIDVSWTDGPTQRMVERIVKGYAGGGFDGMTDYKYRFDSFLDGERVRFGVDFVFAQRRYSDELKARARAKAERIEGLDEWEIQREANVECSKRCDARIAELFARNFEGPRATADVDMAERERSAVYPRAEVGTETHKVNEVQRYDTPEEAAAAAKQGNVISIMDLVPKRNRQ